MNTEILNFKTQNISNAVIYTRTASVQGVNDAKAIEQQEAICRDYAKAHGFNVLHVFSDAGVSGNATERPGFQAMLDYLRDAYDQTQQKHVVIVSDVSRLARSGSALNKLHLELRNAGSLLVMPGMESPTSPEHELMVNTLAAVAQYNEEVLDE